MLFYYTSSEAREFGFYMMVVWFNQTTFIWSAERDELVLSGYFQHLVLPFTSRLEFAAIVGRLLGFLESFGLVQGLSGVQELLGGSFNPFLYHSLSLFQDIQILLDLGDCLVGGMTFL